MDVCSFMLVSAKAVTLSIKSVHLGRVGKAGEKGVRRGWRRMLRRGGEEQKTIKKPPKGKQKSQRSKKIQGSQRQEAETGRYRPRAANSNIRYSTVCHRVLFIPLVILKKNLRYGSRESSRQSWEVDPFFSQWQTHHCASCWQLSNK